jgi:hypothetical protein
MLRTDETQRKAWALCIACAVLHSAACKCRDEDPAPQPTDTPEHVAEGPPPTREEQAIAAATQVVRITADDVRDIDHRDLEIVDAPKFQVRRLGKPKVLAEEKHLRLIGNWPLTPTRGLIAVQTGPDYYAPWVEARLIDLETGDVLTTVDTVYRGYYHKVGLAVGEAEIEGRPYAVLIHASDGQLLPMWPAEERDRRFVAIHPTRGDAFVFRDMDPENEDEELRTLYAHWKDLRAPPPDPDRLLPAPRSTEEKLNPWIDATWIGPTWRDPAPAPTFLPTNSRDPACGKLELGEDGEIRCTSAHTWAMVDGWRAVHDPTSDITVMVNPEQGQAQHLEVGDRCRVKEITFNPPRAILQCSDHKDRILWSPHVTWRIPYELTLGKSSWDVRRHIMHLTVGSNFGSPPTASRWLDVKRGAVVSYGGIKSVWSRDLEQYALFEELTTPNRLMVFDVSGGHTHALPLSSAPPTCLNYGSNAGISHLTTVDCMDAQWRTRWRRMIDLREHLEWVIPNLRGNDIWILPEQSELVAVTSSRGRTRIVKWLL